MIQPIDKRYLDLVDADAKKKALTAYHELVEIFNALETDEELFFTLVDKGYPHNEYEEQQIEEFYFRDQIEAQLDRNSHFFLRQIEQRCIKSPAFMERLAPYALFDEKWWTFTSDYFQLTSNYDVALGYLERIYEYLQYRGNTDLIVINAILNKNEDFFNDVFEVHKKYCGDKTDYERFLSITGKNYHRSFWPSPHPVVVEPGPDFSFNSWRQYFIYCGYGKIDESMRIQGYTESEATSELFSELIRVYEDRQDVLDFLLEDYQYMTGLSTFDYLPIQMSLLSLRQELEMYKNNPHLQRENYSDEKIIDAINTVAAKVDADVLLNKLKELNVDEKYYQNLLLKINLDDGLIENNTKKKINKI